MRGCSKVGVGLCRLQSEQEGCYGGMSMHSSQPILAAACMGGGATPRVDIVDVGPGRLNRRCQLQRTSSDLVSCVAFLPGSELFAIGTLPGQNLPNTHHLRQAGSLGSLLDLEGVPAEL